MYLKSRIKILISVKCFSVLGSALIKIGQTQLRLGGAEREFVRAAMTTFVGPLKRFLEGDMKTIMVKSC